MPIIPLQSIPLESSAIRLVRYSQIINYDECRFFGIARGTETTHCRTIWTLPQRLSVAKYLAEAQFEFEQVVGYPIGQRWITELKREYTCPALAKYGYVIEGGIAAETMVQAAAAVSHITDPATIGPVAVTFTDVDEVHIFHPGTDVEIDPSAVTIAGGFLDIEIPRCRMVTVARADNPAAGLSYTDMSNFEATVDVKRIYNDPSTQAVLYNNHQCSLVCSSSGCSDYSHDACLYIAVPDIGKVEVYPASYASGSWLRISSTCCGQYRFMKLYYRAGIDLDYDTEDAIVRLAHSKMPQDPCGCDPAKALWVRDREVPTILTQERINNPFGLAAGAWWAWMQALALKLYRGGGIL